MQKVLRKSGSCSEGKGQQMAEDLAEESDLGETLSSEINSRILHVRAAKKLEDGHFYALKDMKCVCACEIYFFLIVNTVWKIQNY